MKVGLIDLGSNSIRLVVYQTIGDQLIKLVNIRQKAQSILYVIDNKMTQEGIELIVTVLDELIETAKTFDLDHFKIFATASLRNIDNTKEAVGAIESMIHHPIEVLSEKDETLYGFEGVSKKEPLPPKGLLIDIGGGSLEMTYFENDKAVYTYPLPVGSLSFYHNHVFELIPTLKEQQDMREDIRYKFSQIPWLKNIMIDTIIGIGGSSRALIRLSRELEHIPIKQTTSIISKKDVEKISKLDIHASKTILKATPNRLITIVPAAIMVDELMSLTKASTFKASSYGVREGYLFRKILAID